MLLKDRIAHQGSFLFRWRSFLPLLLLVPLFAALPQSGLLELTFGERAEEDWNLLCLLLVFGGLAIRITTVGFAPARTSGRNTRQQVADRLNTTGLYSVMRNPLYLGNLVTLMGFLMLSEVWWLVAGGIAAALFYYERIIFTEETFLREKFGETYEKWARRTPLLLPRLSNWRAPDMPFSVRTVLRREYHGVLQIVVVTTMIEFLSDIVGERQSLNAWLADDTGWLVYLAVGIVFYATVRIIRKRTGWLSVEGR